MRKSLKTEFAAFLKAVETSGQSTTSQAACHHSAVEVNDWQKIKSEIKRSLSNGESIPTVATHRRVKS